MKLVWARAKERLSIGQLGPSIFATACKSLDVSFAVSQQDVSYSRLEVFLYVRNSPETVCHSFPNFSSFNNGDSATSSSGEASNQDGIHFSVYPASLRQLDSSSPKTYFIGGSRRFYCCANGITCISYTSNV